MEEKEVIKEEVPPVPQPKEQQLEHPPQAINYLQTGLPVAFIGLDYRFAQVNESFCELTGYTAEELRSIKLPDLVHPSEKTTMQKELSAVLSGQLPVHKSEKRLIRRSNRFIWISVSLSLARDDQGFPKYVVTAMEDINRKRRLEHELSSEKEKLSELIESTDLYVLNTDRNHTILYINENLKDVLFGITDIVIETGYNLQQLIPPLYSKKYEEIYVRGFNGESFTTAVTFDITDGKKVTVELMVRAVKDEMNMVINLVITGKDISALKQKEAELLRDKDAAEISTKAKASFLAMMSHEIRTPLNGLIGMGKLLSQTSLNPKQQEFVSSMMLSGEALLALINDILDYSKIESEKMALEQKSFSLRRCIEESLELTSPRAIEKNIHLRFEIQKDVPRYIIGDITRVRQVLLNLVSNAIKFTDYGEVVIHIESRPVEDNSLLTGSGQALEITFEVRDTGIGIPSDKLARLFKAFMQADVSTAKKYGGTGLGLAISKNLVEMMGGRIWARSDPGKGSSFLFNILTRAASRDEIPDGSKAITLLTRATVLLISDERREENIFNNYFEQWGMKVLYTHNFEEVIRIVQAEDQKINLVTIDGQMVTMKPVTIAERIRRYVAKEILPIIMLNVSNDEIMVDITDKILSAAIPADVDRSKLLDMLISVFAIEEHQRQRQQTALAGLKSSELGRKIPMRILVAEDNAINQKLVSHIFESLGYKIDIAENGMAVVRRMKEKDYDLIFMDVQMPEMDGFETTKYIREKMKPAHQPVIVAMTAFALEGDKEKCLQAGMDDYISKPFMIEEIVQRIEKWSGKGGQETDLLNMEALDRLRSLNPDDPDNFVRELIGMFLQQAPPLIAEIEQCCLSKDYSSLWKSAHKLKGSALNLGATALGEACRILEVAGKENKIDDCATMVSRMKAIYSRTEDELQQFLSK